MISVKPNDHISQITKKKNRMLVLTERAVKGTLNSDIENVKKRKKLC